MKVYNKDKTEELKKYDLEKGYLIDDKLLIAHHEAVQEQGHYETIAENEFGGKEVEWKIDVAGVPAYDEFEDIQVYIPYTEKELLQRELYNLEDWFVNYYDIQVKQYERCQRRGKQFDKDIGKLDEEADKNASRISEIRELLKEE